MEKRLSCNGQTEPGLRVLSLIPYCTYLGWRDVLYKKKSAQIGQDVSFIKMAGMI